MGGDKASRIETAAAVVAAVALAGALGFAGFALLDPAAPGVRFAAGGCGGLIGLWLGWIALARLGGRVPDFPIATFDLGAVHIAAAKPDVLDLTEVYPEPLELNDVLEQVGPGARVVRLFDSAAMPSPGELHQRIERHLGRGTPSVAPPDASDALVEALTQLRQSLR